MKIIIERLNDNGKQTTGILSVVDDEVSGNEIIFQCLTLELSWKDNKRNISCIPLGNYKGEILDYSSSFNYPHIWIKDVPNRGGIKVHIGNKYNEIRGCVIVGDKWKDINNDNIKDVVNSRVTLEKLLEYLEGSGEFEGSKFILEINII